MTPALYRRYLREVLSLSSPFRITEKALADAVQELLPGELDLTMFREAVEWSMAKDYLRSATNEDTDQKEFYLTSLGEAKAARD